MVYILQILNLSLVRIEQIIKEEQHAFSIMNEIIVQVNIMLKFFYLRAVSVKTKINITGNNNADIIAPNDT